MRTYESQAGSHVSEAVNAIITMANADGEPVSTEFNGVTIVANPGAEAKDLLEFFDAQLKRNAEAYRNSPEGKAAAERDREYERREREKRQRVAALNLQPMTVKADLAQEYAEYVAMNSKDGYSKGVVDFTERWAALMEIGISQLNDRSDPALFMYFQKNARGLSSEADTQGITGFMHGCAASALAHFWIYGEPLRRWYNLDTQIGSEGEKANETGGVLNPALMNLG